ncbi:NAD(P)-dependent oxidoreductase [Taibaiella koreensis]|uniref:NAD(P)-dependent oxidoreductase n=1 Tax=Taibaiella koreensis TaxID=1268548 RepID=UPI000E59A84F|nr:NAD(P)H-binding protein [Taibaiella koreensis]
MNNRLIAVIGGAGKSGQYLVQELLRQGYPLRLLHRHPGNLPPFPASIQVLKGDARNAADIARLLEGCSAVISTLGQPANEPPIFSTATHHVLETMAQHSIGRYIVTTGLSVDTPQDRKSPWVQEAGAWMHAHYAATTTDKQAEYTMLQASVLNWTLVRLPRIILTHEAKEIQVSTIDCPGQQVHACDLANFLASQLLQAQYHRAAPFIASL